MVISINFDGTCVKDEYPQIGSDCPGAENVLKRFVSNGNNLILNTIRDGEKLEDAKKWFEEKGIPLYGVNVNPDQKSFTSSPKVYADIHIDSKSVGAILTADFEGTQINGKPYIDWVKLGDFVSKVYGSKNINKYSMGKYDDMFNNHFSDDDFDGNEEKRKMALDAFNKMMESLQDIKITDEFISKYLENLSQGVTNKSDNPYDISKILEEDGAVILPLLKDSEKMLKDYGLTFHDTKVNFDDEGYVIINEEWRSPDNDYLINQCYMLGDEVFSDKSEEIRERIVQKMIKKGYISGVNNEYLNGLNKDNQKKYYTILLKRSVEEEMYEESALYRDKLNSII